MPRRVAIDTGGTFTDLVAVEGDDVRTHKVPSTPHDPSRAFFQAVEAVGGADLALHGTTIVVNALLEGKTARTALVTTAGFEDVEEIGRQDREDLYALHPTRSRPVLSRAMRIGVRERVGPQGDVITPLSDAEVRRVVASVRKKRAESVAVCLLHSYANPAHERRLADALRRAGFAVSESHRVLREFREFERTAVTTLNARALPLLSRYACALQRGLDGRPLGFLRSNGGLASPREVRDLPVATIASGPAGGALGALALAEATRLGPIVTFDMGGTSTDAAVIDGALPVTTESSVIGVPVPLPAVDVRSVGTGGGSIARIRRDGVLRVGPESAGANPGPVCYGRGEELTVTDANVALGRCDPRGLLGGDFPLHADRIKPRIERLGRALGMSQARAAEAILQLAEETMSGVLRLLTVRQGLDPRRFALFTFGGAGGLHAVALARSLGMREVVVPRLPGAFSAFGMLFADAVHDVSETVLAAAGDPRLRTRIDALARRALAELRSRGLPASRWRVERTVDLRYEGQSFELRVPFGPRLAERFAEAHRARYGFVADRRVVAVTLRARAVGVRPKPAVPRWRATTGDARIGTQRVTWAGATRAVPAFDREHLHAGARVAGPALVLEYSATTWVPPGAVLRVDPWGSLRIAP
ncbi:MAG: hydantoinase/oxoprolinase family protein [Planctomycetota bacterium]